MNISVVTNEGMMPTIVPDNQCSGTCYLNLTTYPASFLIVESSEVFLMRLNNVGETYWCQRKLNTEDSSWQKATKLNNCLMNLLISICYQEQRQGRKASNAWGSSCSRRWCWLIIKVKSLCSRPWLVPVGLNNHVESVPVDLIFTESPSLKLILRMKTRRRLLRLWWLAAPVWFWEINRAYNGI